ncbi:peptide synthase [Candidatus Magnetomorum sp. HK-1]|nr:peptide synthase [Candidatus Magnetomorum sp. HK-1]
MINYNPQKNETGIDTSSAIEQSNVSKHIVTLAQKDPYKKMVLSLSGRDDNGKMGYSHLTCRQFNQQSDDIARGLQRAGVVRGTKTALQMEPGIEWFAVTYALLKIGAVPILLQPSIGLKKMAQCVKEVEPEALVTSPRYQMSQLFYSGYYQSVHLHINTNRRWYKKGLSLADLQHSEPGPFQIAGMRDNDPGMIVFSTSNETDIPKPTLLTHGTLNNIVDLLKSVMKINDTSVLFTTFPFFMILAPSMGIRQLLPESHSMKASKINPRIIVESIWDHGISHLIMSPTRLMILGNFLKNESIFLPSIQRIMSWGEPFPAPRLQQLHYFIHEKTQIFPLYGMVEAPVVATIGSHEIVSETQIKTERGFGICQGKEIKGMEMRIIEVSDRPIDNWSDDLLVSDGNIGELVVKGNAVSSKYINNVKADALTKIPDGKGMWHRTGDVGWIDSKGYFWFCGRKKDRIIISEEDTLHTIPCEAVFMQHQRVYRCIIAGVGPIPYQMPVLIIELAPGDSGKYISTLTHELTEMAQAYPHTGNIKKILFRKSFPVHPLYNQKINRKELTIWAAKKLGKSLPDELPDRSTSEPAVYPSSLEKKNENNTDETFESEEKTPSTDISGDSQLSEPLPLPEDLSEMYPEDDLSFQTEQIETDDFSPRKPFMERLKKAFHNVKDKARSAIKKPEPLYTNESEDIADVPDVEYITGEHQVSMSEQTPPISVSGSPEEVPPGTQSTKNTLISTSPPSTLNEEYSFSETQVNVDSKS